MEVLHDPLLGRNSSPFPCGRSRVVLQACYLWEGSDAEGEESVITRLYLGLSLLGLDTNQLGWVLSLGQVNNTTHLFCLIQIKFTAYIFTKGCVFLAFRAAMTCSQWLGMLTSPLSSAFNSQFTGGHLTSLYSRWDHLADPFTGNGKIIASYSITDINSYRSEHLFSKFFNNNLTNNVNTVCFTP